MKKDYYIVKAKKFKSIKFDGLLSAYAYARNTRLASFEILLCDGKSGAQHTILRTNKG